MVLILGVVLLAPPATHADECVSEHNPMYAVICQPDPPGLCPRPSISLDGSADVQGVTVIVEIPDYGVLKAVAIRLTAFWKDGQTWHQLWEHRSVQDIPAGGLPAFSQVRLGVPGLVENMLNEPDQETSVQAAVEFDNGTMSCPSPLLSVDTPDFPSLGPAPPDSNIAWTVWDDYNRPGTDSKCPLAGDTGDGLGPLEVYSDCASYGGLQGGEAKIDAGENEAIVEWAGGFSYMLRDDQDNWHPHTFAEGWVRADMSAPFAVYNLQVQSRLSAAGAGEFKAFAAKLVKGPRGCTGSTPALFVVRVPAEDDEAGYNLAKCENGVVMPIPGTDPPEYAGVLCEDNVPLDQEDGATGKSIPAWLSIEVEKESVSGDPVVTGRVVWYTDDNPPVMKQCIFTREFVGDPGNMNYVRHGKWGMSFHEKSYFLDLFRAGYTPQVSQ